jgi:hypothetical protein
VNQAPLEFRHAASSLLGKGKRFFFDRTAPRELVLTSTKAASSGVIISTYTPAGQLRTGSFQDKAA